MRCGTTAATSQPQWPLPITCGPLPPWVFWELVFVLFTFVDINVIYAFLHPFYTVSLEGFSKNDFLWWRNHAFILDFALGAQQKPREAS
jgi:hypothetical protein